MRKALRWIIPIALAIIFGGVVLQSVVRADFTPDHPVIFGVSFSPYYAESLGLDWRKTYLAILDDLQVDRVRLAAYWDHLEPVDDQFNFSDLDWQMEMARKRNVGVVLTVGRKLPRWPECFDPSWLHQRSAQDQLNEVLEVVDTIVQHYRGYDNLVAWQVENEPLVGWFGVCPDPDPTLLKREIDLVRQLDSRPIIVTDSGELSTWWRASQYPDILGTTMYRVVSNPWFGVWRWPLPPSYYYYKTQFIKKIHGVDRVIVSELQAEPWSNGPITQLPLDQAAQSFDIDQFAQNVNFAVASGFDEVYLWGAEWWYWMKERQGVPDFWNLAKTLWQ